MLGDATDRDYSPSLSAFEEFARPELTRLVSDLHLDGSSAVLDLGCGVGVSTGLLGARARLVLGVDLSLAHARAAARSVQDARFVVADARHLPFPIASFDLLWACNSLNHLPHPSVALADLARYVRPGGRVAAIQSHVVPELFFAWDYHLDARVRAACHACYRSKYGLEESDTATSPRLLGLVRDAGFAAVSARTFVLERYSPLAGADRQYFTSVFARYWGEKLRPFLDDDDWLQLQGLTNPESPEFCLDREDFHHVQTITLVVGRRPNGKGDKEWQSLEGYCGGPVRAASPAEPPCASAPPP